MKHMMLSFGAICAANLLTAPAHAGCSPSPTFLNDAISCSVDLFTPMDTLTGNDHVEILSGATINADISTSSGNDIFDLNGGTGNADVYLGSGNDIFMYNTDTSTFNGSVDGGTGLDAIQLSGSGSIPFNLTAFENFNNLNVMTAPHFVQQLQGNLAGLSNVVLFNGSGVAIPSGTVINANVSVSGTDPDGSQVLIDGGTLNGSIDFTTVASGSGTQVVSVTNAGVLNGDVDFGDGSDVYNLSGGSTHTGDVDMGTGDDTASILDSTLNGHIDLGDGSDALVLENASITTADLGAGNDALFIDADTSFTSITGGSGEDAVHLTEGGTFDGAGITDFEDLMIDHGSLTVLTGNPLDFPEVYINNGSDLGVDTGAVLNGDILAGDTSMSGVLVSISGAVNGMIDLTTGGDNGAGSQQVCLNENAAVSGGIFTGDGDDLVCLHPSISFTNVIDMGAGSNDQIAFAGSGTYTLAETQPVGVESLTVGDNAFINVSGTYDFANNMDIQIGSGLNITAPTVFQTAQLVNAGTVDATTGGTAGENDVQVTGGYVQTPIGELILSLGANSQTYDQLFVSGTATLDGTLTLEDPNVTMYAIGDIYDLIVADGGISGTFTTENLPTGYLWNTTYGANAYSAEITGFNSLGNLCNQITGANAQAACNGLDGTDPLGGTQPFTSVVSGLTPSQAANVFKQQSALTYAGSNLAGKQAMTNFTGTLRKRMGEQRRILAESNYRGLDIWTRAHGSQNSLDEKADELGFDSTQKGISFGGDVGVGDNLNIGFAAHHSNGLVEMQGAAAQTDIDSRQMAAYATYMQERFYVDAIAAVSDLDYETQRRVQTGTFNGQTAADYNGDGFRTQVEAGYRVKAGGLNTTFEPWVKAGFTNINNESVVERGNDAIALMIDNEAEQTFDTEIGVRAVQDYDFGWGRVSPELRLAYLKEFGSEQKVTARYKADPATSAHIARLDANNDSVLFGIGAETEVGRGMTAFAHYDIGRGSDLTNQQFNIGARWQNTVE